MSNKIRLLCPLIQVEKDPMTKVAKTIPPWEMSIYQNVHGEKVKRIGSKIATVKVPDPGQEFARLERFFGYPDQGKDPHVVEIFGRGDVGVENLRTAIVAGLRNGKVTLTTVENIPYSAADSEISAAELQALTSTAEMLDEAGIEQPEPSDPGQPAPHVTDTDGKPAKAKLEQPAKKAA